MSVAVHKVHGYGPFLMSRHGPIRSDQFALRIGCVLTLSEHALLAYRQTKVYEQILLPAGSRR